MGPLKTSRRSLEIWMNGRLDCWTVGWLEIWTIGLWTVGPFDYNLIQMDDYSADSCAISQMAFLLEFNPSFLKTK